ncbi:MAG: metallophosphatase family protein [Victivallaceae bacterium]|nr:metallophosphatase family protein [Victivallaceae bacterium]
MAKIAILSDIHANADALDAVLERCSGLGIREYISLGDIVGYNAEPVRCIEMLKNLRFRAMVVGNHDDFATDGNIELSGFNRIAQAAIAWTREQLGEEERAFLRRPDSVIIPGTGISAVHATLDTPRNWGYIIEAHHAEDNFSYQLTQLCFCGHSHAPVAFVKDAAASRGMPAIIEIPEWRHNTIVPEGDTDFSVADSLTVSYSRGKKYLFNVGSIGQPRNGDPRASFAVIDTDRATVTRYRLPYDIRSAQQKILDAGLPERLAVRLQSGW